jgi:hypothetical protein
MKTWRQDAHTVPLLVWTALCVVVALVLLRHAPTVASRPLKAAEVAAGIGLLMVGPAVFAAYVWRARSVWVSIEPDGLRISGRRVIPWSAVVRVRRKRPTFRKKSGPVELSPVGDLNPGSGCVDLPGCFDLEGALLGLAVVVLGAALLAAVWLVFFVLLPLLIVPLLEVLAPFGERFTVETASGRPLVLRDLRDADAFAAELSRRVPVEG